MPASVVTREKWSRLGFLFASIGSAVGLGNIWRFPYMVGKNGGGAFLIPYLSGVFLFALPLMLTEFYAGRKFRGSVITTLRKIDKKLWFIGILPLMISISVLSYYLVVTGWTFAYFIFSFTGYLEFHKFVNSMLPLLFFLLSIFTTSVIVSRGIKHGIEKTSMILMPVFFILLATLVFNSFTLPGFSKAMFFYLTPKFSYLSDIKTWMMGFGQAFFSLSVGFGILLTYGSYLSSKRSIPKYSLKIAGADTIVAVLGGFVIFPIVFTFNINPASGTELSFVSLPKIFQSMPFGFVLGAIFFLLLFVAAITSAVSMLEVGVSCLIDEFGWKRKKAVAPISLAVMFLGIPSALSFYGSGIKIFGMPFIDFMDTFFGYMLLLSAALLSISITWFCKSNLFNFKINQLPCINVSRFFYFLLKYFIPFVLITMLVFKLTL